MSLTTTASASSPVGTYTITANGAVDANYTITHTDGTLTNNPAALTVAANSTIKVYGSALPTGQLHRLCANPLAKEMPA